MNRDRITTIAQSPPTSPIDEQKNEYDGATLAQARSEHHPTLRDAHHSVGLAVIEQKSTIPQSGERKVASKLEYWCYVLYYIGGQGVGTSCVMVEPHFCSLTDLFRGGELWGRRAASLAI